MFYFILNSQFCSTLLIIHTKKIVSNEDGMVSKEIFDDIFFLDENFKERQWLSPLFTMKLYNFFHIT